jgi:outer membrane lipoprotein-sorting protein
MPRMTASPLSRRAALLGAGALLPLAFAGRVLAQNVQLTPQDEADLARVQAYLDGVRTIKARFLQVAPNGAQSQGTAWLQRPGRLRFEYDPPANYLLVAGNGILTFYDAGLKQTSNIPLGSTPLGILLAEHVNFSGDLTVTDFTRYPGQLQLSLVRRANPGEGTLTLFFNDNPLSLRGWAVLDAQRRLTRINLYDIQNGGSFNQSLFVFIDPNFYTPQGRNGGGG